MNLLIRRAEGKDIYETSEIYVEAINREYVNFIPSAAVEGLSAEKEAEDCRRWLENGEKFHLMYVAVTDGRIAGFVSAGENAEKPYEYDSEIINLIVRDEYQGEGIGLRLLYEAVQNLRENGFSSVIIYNFCESKANGFYRNLGGKIIRMETESSEGKAVKVDLFCWGLKELIKKIEKILRNHRK